MNLRNVRKRNLCHAPGGFRTESKTVLRKVRALWLIPSSTILRGYYFPPDTGSEV